MSELRIVDRSGKPVILNARQKNEIYRKAKEVREHLRDGMCTKSETRNPTEHNIKKMQREFANDHKKQIYIKSMQAIGAEPPDVDCERLRRKR
jgi:hypothetical protein